MSEYIKLQGCLLDSADEIASLRTQLSAARAEAEQASDRAAEGWGYSNAWMRLHDQAFGWVQQHPAIFKEFCENDPRGDMPSPERVKAALAELREQARAKAIEECAKIADAYILFCDRDNAAASYKREAGRLIAQRLRALSTATTPKGEQQ